jgi:hypothetical protein
MDTRAGCHGSIVLRAAHIVGSTVRGLYNKVVTVLCVASQIVV